MKNARPAKAKTSATLTPAILLRQGELFELSTPAFTGTSNPRHQRVIEALLKNEGLLREQVDKIAGCSNGPELMAELQRKGLSWVCLKEAFIDRDGRKCLRGHYFLTPMGRRQVAIWKANSHESPHK
ncbi:hypothetical protein [Aquitalea denitrificans]|uniref:hypothetical protein n=1 Tax=Aquitalea denitrificans TaxID=519081 RepID=UPI001358215F|nr:hypothetical protein [Aquitalea denitrificans]